MLFGNRKKADEELLQYLDKAFLNNSRSIEDIGKKLEENLEKRLGENLSELETKQEEGNKLLRRQSGSLEDILEELQRQGEEKENVTRQIQELKNREMVLVELCCLLSGQREMILQQLLAEGVLEEEVRVGWQKQSELMEQESAKLERQCTFHRIGMCGEKVDYQCHDILSVYDTRQEEQNSTVAQVFSTGYCYQGNVLKKAQVAVYRYMEIENAGSVETK